MPPKKARNARLVASRNQGKSKAKSSNSSKDPIFSRDGKIVSVIQDNGYRIVKSVPDGNCMFRSISTCMVGDESHHALYRQLSVIEIKRALQKSIAMSTSNSKPANTTKTKSKGTRGSKKKTGGKGCSVIDEGLLDPIDPDLFIPDYHYFVTDGIDAYCKRMARPTVWGGHLELQSIVNVFGCIIVVVQDQYPPITIRPDVRLWSSAPAFAFTLLYRGECHYDAVVPADIDSTLRPHELSTSILSSKASYISPIVKHINIRNAAQTYVQTLEHCEWIDADIKALEATTKHQYQSYDESDDYGDPYTDDEDEDSSLDARHIASLEITTAQDEHEDHRKAVKSRKFSISTQIAFQPIPDDSLALLSSEYEQQDDDYILDIVLQSLHLTISVEHASPKKDKTKKTKDSKKETKRSKQDKKKEAKLNKRRLGKKLSSSSSQKSSKQVSAEIPQSPQLPQLPLLSEVPELSMTGDEPGSLKREDGPSDEQA